MKVIMNKFPCDASSPTGCAFPPHLPTKKKTSDYKKKTSEYKGIKKLQLQLSVSNSNNDFQNLVDAAPTARDEAIFRSLQEELGRRRMVPCTTNLTRIRTQPL